MKYAVIGAGRMGKVVAAQLPGPAEKIVIDPDISAAKELAAKVGATGAAQISAAAEADLVAVVVPAAAIETVMGELAGCVKDGAVVVNMATNGHIPAQIVKSRPGVNFVSAKIMGEAVSITEGKPAYVLTDAEGEVYERVAVALPGYTKVISADPELVNIINTVATAEGIRASVNVKKELEALDIPDDWIDVAIRTVCAGAMLSFAEGRHGAFGKALADRLEAEAQ